VALVREARGPSAGRKPASAAGRDLWDRVVAAYDISDEGGRELLALACDAADRVASLRARIDRDGEVLQSKTGLRDHPALKHELQGRIFISRTLLRLGLNVEPLKGPGRPGSGGLGIVDHSTPWEA
jgi:hypothetical protein